MKNRIAIFKEDNGMILAEWFPLQCGMPIVGRGSTVLEAIGSLVLYDEVVELEPSLLVHKQFSVKEADCRNA